MDPERDADRPSAPHETPPADPELLRMTEPDGETDVSYATWRLDRAADRR